MKIRILLYITIVTISLSTGCKSNYEQIRNSNNPERILREANRFFKDEQYTKAQGLYEVVIPFYRGKKEAEDVFYNYTYLSLIHI